MVATPHPSSGRRGFRESSTFDEAALSEHGVLGDDAPVEGHAGDDVEGHPLGQTGHAESGWESAGPDSAGNSTELELPRTGGTGVHLGHTPIPRPEGSHASHPHSVRVTLRGAGGDGLSAASLPVAPAAGRPGATVPSSGPPPTPPPPPPPASLHALADVDFRPTPAQEVFPAGGLSRAAPPPPVFDPASTERSADTLIMGIALALALVAGFAWRRRWSGSGSGRRRARALRGRGPSARPESPGTPLRMVGGGGGGGGSGAEPALELRALARPVSSRVPTLIAPRASPAADCVAAAVAGGAGAPDIHVGGAGSDGSDSSDSWERVAGDDAGGSAATTVTVSPAANAVTRPYGVRLTPGELASVVRLLPTRLAVRDWSLAFSTAAHGWSLHTLLSLTAGRGPAVLVVQAAGSGHVAAAFLSEGTHAADAHPRAWGTGESFVAALRPRCSGYPWTQEDDRFFRASDADGLCVGSGGYALWLDSDLERGVSRECPTFGSPPLVEAGETFAVAAVDVWLFADFAP